VRREQYDRDDRYRLMEQRIAAYRDFYIAAGAARHVIMGETSGPEIREARTVLWEAFTLLAVIGDETTWDQARKLLHVVTAVAFDNMQFNVKEWNEMIRRFVEVSRLELIPARSAERS
jgi:hypothetical protein